MKNTYNINVITCPAGGGKTTYIIDAALNNHRNNKITLVGFPTKLKVDEAYIDALNKAREHNEVNFENQIDTTEVHSKHSDNNVAAHPVLTEVLIMLRNARKNNTALTLFVTHALLAMLASDSTYTDAMFDECLHDEATAVFITTEKRFCLDVINTAVEHKVLSVFNLQQYLSTGVFNSVGDLKDMKIDDLHHLQVVATVDMKEYKTNQCAALGAVVDFFKPSELSDGSIPSFLIRLTFKEDKAFLDVMKTEVSASVKLLRSPKTSMFTANWSMNDIALLAMRGIDANGNCVFGHMDEYFIANTALPTSYHGYNRKVIINFMTTSSFYGKRALINSPVPAGSTVTPDNLLRSFVKLVERDGAMKGLLITNKDASSDVINNPRWTLVKGDVRGLNGYTSCDAVAALFSFNMTNYDITCRLNLLQIAASESNITWYRQILNNEHVYQAIKRGAIRNHSKTSVLPFKAYVLTQQIAEFLNELLTREGFSVEIKAIAGGDAALKKHMALVGKKNGRPTKYPSDNKNVRSFFSDCVANAERGGEPDVYTYIRERIPTTTQLKTNAERKEAFETLLRYEYKELMTGAERFGGNTDEQ